MRKNLPTPINLLISSKFSNRIITKGEISILCKSAILIIAFFVFITSDIFAQIPVAKYPFNGNANDESGNGNDGIVFGATLATDRFGNTGKSYYFDGISNYIDLSGTTIAKTGNSTRSIFLWVKTSRSDFYHAIISTGTASDNNAFNLRTAGNYLSFMGYNNDYNPSSGKIITDDKWHCVGITYDGAIMKGWVDGAMEWQISIVLNTTGQDNFIGKNNHAGSEAWFEGYIDDVSIYDHVLDNFEIGEISQIPPQIIDTKFAPDNSFVDLIFNRGLYSSTGGTGPLNTNDFNLVFQRNGGNCDNVQIVDITRLNGEPLAGGENAFRVHFNVLTKPSGTEKIKIEPKFNEIWTLDSKPLPTSQASPLFNLHPNTVLSFANYIFSSDNWNTDVVNVYNTVNIDNGGSLVINPGTVIKFMEFGKIDVQGKIDAMGNPDKEILFTSRDTSGFWNNTHKGWQGIDYISPSFSNDSSRFAWCRIEYAKDNAGDGGAFSILNWDKLLMKDCKIMFNATLNKGGGFFLNNARIKLSNNLISNNKAVFGGAIYIDQGDPLLSGNLIKNNVADDFGGAIKFFWANPKLANNTIVNNIAGTDGGGLYFEADANPQFLDNIIWGNKIGNVPNQVHILDDNCEPSFLNNDIQGGKDAFTLGGGVTYTGIYISNIQLDPKFQNVGDFRLQNISPCINAGVPDTAGFHIPPMDIDNNPRIFSGNPSVIDIGAYEFQGDPDLPPVVGFGRAYQFDGVNDSVRVNYFNLMNNTSYEIWFQTTNPNAGIFEFSDGFTTTNSLIVQGGNLKFVFWNSGPNYITSTSIVNDGKWHHAAVVTDNFKTYLYLDGNCEKIMNLFTTETLPKLKIGYSGFESLMTGQLDEFRIWSKALTPNEIRDRMYKPLEGKESDLQIYLPFDEGFGNIASDFSSFHRNGPVFGDPVRVNSILPVSFLTRKGVTLNNRLPGYDPDKENLNFQIIQNAVGNFSLNNSSFGDFNYTRNFAGRDSLTYKITAPGEMSSVCMVYFDNILNIKDSIPTNMSWAADTVKVWNNLLISNLSRLDINPKTVVKFMGPYRLDVFGQIVAIGDPLNKTLFTAENKVAGWQGISFINISPSNDSSKFVYCIIEHANKTGYGGGIFISNFSKLFISKSEFRKNKATIAGGAIALTGSGPWIVNNLIYNNEAPDGGGIAVTNAGSSAIINNNAIYNNQFDGIFVANSPTARINNNTISNNKGFGVNLSVGSANLQNTIIWGNQIAINGTPTIQYSDIQVNYGGTGNLNLDPKFITATAGAGSTVNTFTANWSLQGTSPAINAGNPNTIGMLLPQFDLADNPRFMGANVDMGAYEYRTPTAVANCNITSDVAWEAGTVNVNCNVHVSNHATLTIKSGTKVQFNGHYYIEVDHASILADGQAGQKIIFTSQNRNDFLNLSVINTGWYGIKLFNADSTVFNNCTFEYARGFEGDPGTQAPYEKGGAIYAENTDTLHITNCIFQKNLSTNMGGAIHLYASKAKIMYNTFEFNKDTTQVMGAGGAVFINSNCKVGIEHNNFNKNNSQGRGGAIFNADSHTGIAYNIFTENTADMGAAIYAVFSDSTIVFNEFSHNHATGPNAYTGAIHLDNANCHVAKNKIFNNDATISGAIHCFNSTPFIEQNVIVNNTAKNNYGGAISCVSNSNPVIINNTIANNLSKIYGGAIYIDNSSPELINNIIYGNTSTDVIGNQIDIAGGSNPVFKHNDIQGDTTNFTTSGSNLNFAGAFIKNINFPPTFVQPTVGAGSNIDATSAIWSLKPESPCINTGTPNAAGLMLAPDDFEGKPRVYVGFNPNIIDMGAFEYQSNPLFNNFNRDVVAAEMVYQNLPTRVFNSILINDGASLMINPNSKIYFQGYFNINVQGRIQSMGVQGQEILMARSDTSGFWKNNNLDGGWGGIIFDNTPASNDTSKIYHTHFQFGKKIPVGLYQMGGAIYGAYFSKLKISNSFIETCKAFHGGGMYFETSAPLITNCTIKNNTAFTGGGGISAHASDLILKENQFVGNKGGDGGGIVFSTCNGFVINNTFRENIASAGGGAFMIVGSSGMKIHNNLIHNNIANHGGAFYLFGPGSQTTLFNNTIVQNNADKGGAIVFASNTAVVLKNNIIWDNTATTAGSQVYISNSNDYPAFFYNDIKGGIDAFAIETGSFSGTYDGSNIDNPPLFVDLGNKNYDLTDLSPCINQGTTDTVFMELPAVDLIKRPRVFPLSPSPAAHIDMGAFEVQKITAYAGDDKIVCANHTFMNANNPGNPSFGEWTISNGSGLFLINTLYNTEIVNINLVNNLYMWTIKDGWGGPALASDEVVITNQGYTVNMNVQSDGQPAFGLGNYYTVCSGDVEIMAELQNAESNIIPPDEFHWTSKDLKIGFTNPDNPITFVMDLTPGEVTTVGWMARVAGCVNTGEFIMRNIGFTVNAGVDQTVCDENATISAITPNTGSWAQLNLGTPAIVNCPSCPTSSVVLQPGWNSFGWWGTNYGCTSSDTVFILNQGPSPASACCSETICDTYKSVSATPPDVGIGHWEKILGNGIITSPSSNNTEITSLTPGVLSKFRWVVAAGSCSDSDTIAILSNSAIAEIVANSVETCTPEVVLNATNPSLGTGFWQVSSSPSSQIIETSTSPTTRVILLDPDFNAFMWTVTTGSCMASDEIFVYNHTIYTVEAGVDQTVCYASPHNLFGSTLWPGETGFWTALPSSTALFGNSLGNNTQVTNLSTGLNTFRWTVNHGACQKTDEVKYYLPDLTVNAGTDQTVCSTTADLNGNIPVGGTTGYWQNLGAPIYPIIANSLSNVTSVSQLRNGDNFFRWTLTNGSCSNTAEVRIRSNLPSFVTAGAAQTVVCSNAANLYGNVPGGGETGVWSKISGGAVSFSAITNPSTLATGLAPNSSYKFAWTINKGSCSASATVDIVTVNLTANAGADQTVCSFTGSLNGSAITIGATGLWTYVTPMTPPSITPSNNPIATATGLNFGENKFEWKLIKLTCVSKDTVNLTKKTATTAVAGADQTLCIQPYNMIANSPGGGEIGSWSQISPVSPLATLGNINDPFTSVSSMLGGTNYQFKWTITNGSCSTTSIINILTNFSTTNAGANQTVCSGNQVNMAAANPAPGSGMWTGFGTIISNIDPLTLITNLVPDTNAFTWTVTNPMCSGPSASDDVLILNYTPSTPNATANKINCCDPAEIILTTGIPTYGTGSWSAVNTPGQVISTGSNNWKVQNLIPGANIFRWTVKFHQCTLYKDITINYQKIPAFAGNDKLICTDSMKMEANSASPGIGQWSIKSGSGSFVNPNGEKTTLKKIGRGQNIYKWTITNGTCVTYDSVIINNFMVIANAGQDQTVCNDTSTIRAIPDQYPGSWSTASGATIANSNLATSKVSGLPEAVNNFVWTVSNNLCTSADTVKVDNSRVYAFAGTDRTVCSDTVKMAATVPVRGSGTWIPMNTTVLISNVSDPGTTITKLTLNRNDKFIWRVTKNHCFTQDTVSIMNGKLTALAGNNTSVCVDKYMMTATLPVRGSGLWTKTGASIIADPKNNQTPVDKLALGPNSFTWTVSDNFCKASSQVTITNNLPVVNAGEDITVCNTSVNLKGNVPASGTGIWTVGGGTASIVNPQDPATQVKGLKYGDNKFVWTIRSNNCINSDTVNVVGRMLTASAGGGQTICTTTAALNAQRAVNGSGAWSNNGNAVIGDRNSNTTPVSNLTHGDNVFMWYVTNKNCSASDYAIVKNFQVTANAGADQIICFDSTFMKAIKPLYGAGTWNFAGGKGILANLNDPFTLYTRMPLGINTLTWQVKDHNCSSIDSVIITNQMLKANAGPDKVVCTDTTFLDGKLAENGKGKWTSKLTSVVIDNPNNAFSTVRKLNLLDNIFTWTLTNQYCTSSDDVVIKNYRIKAEVEKDKVVCIDTTHIKGWISGNPGKGSWISRGTAVLSNAAVFEPFVTKLAQGKNLFTWKVNNEFCKDSANLTVQNDMVKAVLSSFDTVVCANEARIIARASQFGTGLWTSPDGLKIPSPTSPENLVSGLKPGPNKFSWKVQNQNCKDSIAVVIQNKQVKALVEADKVICENQTDIKADKPAQGNGKWKPLDNNALINNLSVNETKASNLNFGPNKFQWTVSLDKCISFDTLLVTNKNTGADAGKDTIICSDLYVLNGKAAPGSIVKWELTNGSANIVNPASLVTEIRKIGLGRNIFVLTAGNDKCTRSDTVVVTSRMVEANAFAGSQAVCEDSVIIYGELIPSVGTTGVWTTKIGTGSVSKLTESTFLARGLSKGDNVFSWTVKNENCQAFEDVRVINNKLDANFAFQTKENSSEYQFFGISSGKPGNWQWNFGDETETSGIVVSHTFLAENVYNVCLTVFDETTGCSAGQCKRIDVGKVNCRADFSYKAISENDSTIEFTNLSLGDVTNYSWKFDDGSSSTEKNIKHTFPRSAVYNVCLVAANKSSGCVSEVCELIKVGQPTCSLVAKFDYFFDGSSVYFKDVTQGRLTSWYWEFGDQSTSAQKDPIHKFPTFATYTVRLSVYDSVLKCAGSYVKQINLKQPECNASFNFYYSPDDGKQIIFQNQSTGKINKYFWNFGDNSSSGLRDVIHTYNDSKVYKVELVVSDTISKCRDFAIMDIPVGIVDCDARFDYFVDSVATTVYFFNKPLKKNSLVYWQFGDGGKSAEINPVHRYPKPGYYQVTLTTFNEAAQCMDYNQMVILVSRPGDAVNADFTYQINENDRKVSFYNTSEGINLSSIWNFDDDLIETIQDPVHYYKEFGYYNVCLSVYNKTGLSDIICKVINIPALEDKACNANFIFTVDEKNKTVNFKDISNGNPDWWQWHFGDEETSDLQNPAHLYKSDGLYRVHLHIKNNKNQCSDHQIKYVNVSKQEGLFMTFGYLLNNVFYKSGGYPTDFMSSSFGTPAKAVWDFGDGTKDSTSLTPNHTYKEAGTYKVCITATDPVTGMKTTTCQDVIITAASGISSSAKMNATLSNYPNPLKSVTYITYLLTENTRVELDIYDVLGHKIAALVNHQQQAGIYTLEWNKGKAKTGIYFLRLLTPKGFITKKMVISE